MYEMAALRPPFKASNAIELAEKIRKGQIPALPKQYSNDLFSVIQSMMNQDPNLRPSMLELKDHPRISKEIKRKKKI